MVIRGNELEAEQTTLGVTTKPLSTSRSIGLVSDHWRDNSTVPKPFL